MKHKSRRFTVALLFAVFVAGVLMLSVSPAGAADKRSLSAAHVMSERDPYHIGLSKFTERVAELTNGRYEFTLYPSGQLGGERDMTEGVSMGTIDIALLTNAFCVNLAPELGVLDFPYLFESRPDAYKVLDSEIGTELFKNLERSNIIGLAFMENGFRSINTRNALIVTPDQIKGVKLRTMETPVHLAAFNAAGANATPVSWTEIYTALQQGTVMGHENPLKAMYDSKTYELCPYISMTEHFYSTVNLIINKGVWESIPPEDQALFRQAAAEARDFQRQYCQDWELEVAKRMKDAGTTIAENIDKAQWKKAMSPVYSDPKLSKQHEVMLKKIKDFLGYTD
ncbi:ABC transporter substrate-binding protein [Synergistales bacterium]|nr:ABC transporter substrate-binding protein [Synergistales bacterium]